MQNTAIPQFRLEPFLFIELGNWSYQDFLKRIKAAQRQTQSLSWVASQQVERAIRSHLMELLPMSDRRILRFGEDGKICYRELDGIAFSDDTIYAFEIKLTDNRKYAREGIAQLDEIRDVLKRNGCNKRIVTRLIIVSDDLRVVNGLGPTASISDMAPDFAILRVDSQTLESWAERSGVGLPANWNSARARYQSLPRSKQRRPFRPKSRFQKRVGAPPLPSL